MHTGFCFRAPLCAVYPCCCRVLYCDGDMPVLRVEVASEERLVGEIQRIGQSPARSCPKYLSSGFGFEDHVTVDPFRETDFPNDAFDQRGEVLGVMQSCWA